MKWITRENARVDRIACPWLIRKFVDPDATFIFAPKDRVMEEAERTGAIPFDVPGAELYHYRVEGREFVSFDAIIRKYKLEDAPLHELAKIVRGADASLEDTPPESPGLEAAAIGFSRTSGDDFENMRRQFPLYDALYEYCRLKVSDGNVLKHSLR
ncbi:MAG: chromate resistance protein [Candidatus Thermoplasmatota archaeon]|nr:chromate resistance protein [Candidatus Thermoplasmatota archaeon]MCL5790064.1 chromate resistance protein [Candidatus Thermoplasmatota archaeon]